MPNIFTLTCPNCGGKLEITEDINRFACGHCGIEHIVQRQGGTVSLLPVIEELKRIEHGTDRTASELAIQRLNSEVAQLRTALDNKERILKSNKELVFWLLFAPGAIAIAISCMALVAFFVGMAGISTGVISLLVGVGLLFLESKANNTATTDMEISTLRNALNEKINEIEYYRNLVRQ